MSKRKADCTPEEWGKFLARQRKRRQQPDVRKQTRESGREYRQRPGFREHQLERGRKYNSRPDVRARILKYKSRPDVRERLRKLAKKHYSNPDVRERIRKYNSRPERRERQLENSHKRLFGASPGTRALLAGYQGNRCPICRSLFTKTPALDHCHETGIVRGLLCSMCNRVEGMIKKTGVDPQELGKRLAEYLANPPAKQVQDLLE